MNEDVKNSAELDEPKKALEGEVVIPEQTHSKTLEVQTVEDVMENNFLRYSMSVIVDRALPDVRDGMKPVHRRIVYVMIMILEHELLASYDVGATAKEPTELFTKNIGLC